MLLLVDSKMKTLISRVKKSVGGIPKKAAVGAVAGIITASSFAGCYTAKLYTGPRGTGVRYEFDTSRNENRNMPVSYHDEITVPTPQGYPIKIEEMKFVQYEGVDYRVQNIRGGKLDLYTEPFNTADYFTIRIGDLDIMQRPKEYNRRNRMSSYINILKEKFDYGRNVAFTCKEWNDLNGDGRQQFYEFKGVGKRFKENESFLNVAKIRGIKAGDIIKNRTINPKGRWTRLTNGSILEQIWIEDNNKICPAYLSPLSISFDKNDTHGTYKEIWFKNEKPILNSRYRISR